MAQPDPTSVELDLSSIHPAKVVDARGVACPGPLLEAKKAIGTVSVGQTLEILSGDPSTRADLPRWAKMVGHEYLGATHVDDYDRIFVTRGK
jgi:TusA-related sulfurtransferase